MTTRRAFVAGFAGLSIITAFGDECFGARVRATSWPSGRRAAASLTYDDGLSSQLDNAVPELDRLAFRATFFLTRANVEARIADWQAVARSGHEIGDHTFHHPCELLDYSGDRFEQEEILPTEQFLNVNFGENTRRTYAYPCGLIELGRGSQLRGELEYIGALRRHFAAARAADGDPNDPRLVGRQRYQLQAVAPTYKKDDPGLAIAYLRKALALGRWAILIFHEILPARLGDGDTSIASHAMILRWIAQRSIWCAPMGEVFAHLMHAKT